MIEIPQTMSDAMRMQARFENAPDGEENQRLLEWLCAEIAHAHTLGVDWVQQPTRPVECLQDFNLYKLIARSLAMARAGAPTCHIKVA